MTQSPTRRPVPVAPDVEGHYAGYRVPLSRRRWVRRALPWATSIGVHLGILVLVLIVFAPALRQNLAKLVQLQVNVPTTELAETNIGGVPNVGNLDDVTSQNAQLNPVEQSDNPLPAGVGDVAGALTSAGGSPAAGGGVTGITGTDSLASALGGGGGGQGSTLFGEPGGGGKFMGFDTGVSGDGGRVTRIVFVCDASGSMVDGSAQSFLVTEIKKGIAPLEPVQFFNIIFFRQSSAESLFTGLVPANARTLSETNERLNGVTYGGDTNPIPALEVAFKLKPQLVFFITDGAFNGMADYDEVLQTIRTLNKGSEAEKTMINTIQLVRGENDEDLVAAEALRTIAHENRGDYRPVQTGRPAAN